LDGTLRETGVFGHAVVAEGGRFLASAFGLAPDVEVDEEGRGGFVVADEIAHQDVEDVFVKFCHEGQYTLPALAFRRHENSRLVISGAVPSITSGFDRTGHAWCDYHLHDPI
jgi:hypothetical protein